LKACESTDPGFVKPPRQYLELEIKTRISEWESDQSKANSFIDYVIFALPNIGFLGTILGLTLALSMAYEIGIPNPDPFHKTLIIGKMSTQLGMAFYTTLVALLALMPIAFLMYLITRFQSFVGNLVLIKTMELYDITGDIPSNTKSV
jgi:biopolymer transport protein ExbB/TolQ